MMKDHEQWTQFHDNSSPDAKLKKNKKKQNKKRIIEPFLST